MEAQSHSEKRSEELVLITDPFYLWLFRGPFPVALLFGLPLFIWAVAGAWRKKKRRSQTPEPAETTSTKN